MYNYEYRDDPRYEPEHYCYRCEDTEKNYNSKVENLKEFMEGIKETVYLDPIFSNEKFQHCFEMLCDMLEISSNIGDVKSVEIIRERK